MESWEVAYIAGIIDGEGSITLTKIHENEHRRPCITIASTDKELLIYVQTVIGGSITNKKNYKPELHKESYTLNIKKKETVLSVLKQISPYLRINKKRNRAIWIVENYEKVTLRNGKYNEELYKQKLGFEETFFLAYKKDQQFYAGLLSTLCMVETAGRAFPCFRHGTDYILNLQESQVLRRIMRNIIFAFCRQDFAS